MSIAFEPSRWAALRERSRRWWAGELDGPLIQIRLVGKDPGRPEPELPGKSFTAFYDPSVPAEAIVDRWDYDLCREEYLGDAFPQVWPNFGPGVLAALLGAVLECDEDAQTVWFCPDRDREIGELSFTGAEDGPWLARIRDLMEAAGRRWQGNVQVAMTDLGGGLDVLSTFRPGHRLLLDLCDEPALVEAKTWEIHAQWWKAYERLNDLLQPGNPGYTAWTPLFSSEPYYMLQCDFCYMIGPAMFDRFVKPDLAENCRKLVNPFYHLDGPGQLPHLDSLLEIEELKGVQWVPGEGQPPVTGWPDVYRRIRDAGKLVQWFGAQTPLGFRALDALTDQLGSARGIAVIAEADVREKDEVLDFLRKYGVDAE